MRNHFSIVQRVYLRACFKRSAAVSQGSGAGAEVIGAKLSGFTLLELLVVIGIIGILASMLLPSLSKAKGSAQKIKCLSNLRQLQLGYTMYAEENGDKVPPNKSVNIRNVEGSWALGNAQLDKDTTNIQAGVLFPFTKSTAIYACPADQAKVKGHPGLRRTRSYSGAGPNTASEMHGKGWDWKPSDFPGYPVSLTLSRPENVPPGPSKTFIFIDEDEQSIDDGILAVGGDAWWELPAERHNQGCNLSFIDGHAEYRRWLAPKKFRKYQQPVDGAKNSADRRDLDWLYDHTLWKALEP